MIQLESHPGHASAPNTLPSSRRTYSGRLAAAVLLLSLLASACSESGGPTGNNKAAPDSLKALPRTLTAVEQEGVRANTQFALQLLRSASANASSNVLLSPLSVSLALGMTMNGADGRTLTEMQQTLGWGARSQGEINTAYRDLSRMLPTLDNSVTIRLANGIWTRAGYPAGPEFAQKAREFFNAPVQTLATPQLMYDSVNAWGRRETQNMIPKVLDGNAPNDLAMLLANAVYFAGSWRNAFETAKTKPEPFRLASGASVSVPMMQRKGGFNAFQDESVSAVEMLYGNGAYSMVLMQPTTGSASQLASQLNEARYNAIVSSLRPADSESFIALPRFSVKGGLDLSRTLAGMGMPTAFSGFAEFPYLVPSARTNIGSVQHAVALDVFEQGTRAAAVTVVDIRLISAPPSYRFDAPFVFFIRERLSGTILFAGVLNDPRA